MLETILREIEKDDKWDEDDPVQKGYKMAGEPRYNMAQLRKAHKKTTHTSFYEESSGVSKEKKSKDKNAIENVPALRIKVESPVWRDFKQKLAVLKSGKGFVL